MGSANKPPNNEPVAQDIQLLSLTSKIQTTVVYVAKVDTGKNFICKPPSPNSRLFYLLGIKLYSAGP